MPRIFLTAEVQPLSDGTGTIAGQVNNGVVYFFCAATPPTGTPDLTTDAFYRLTADRTFRFKTGVPVYAFSLNGGSLTFDVVG